MLTKVDIVRQLYEQTNKKIPMKELDVLVDKTFEIISDNIKDGKVVQISGFGVFSLPEQVRKPVVRIKKQVNE